MVKSFSTGISGFAWLILLLVSIGTFIAPIEIKKSLGDAAIFHHDGQRYYLTTAEIVPKYLQIDADSEEHPHRSKLSLAFDNVPLGPAHAVHERIRTEGKGAYSHYMTVLFLSSPDGSDPRENQGRYSVKIPVKLHPLLSFFVCLLGIVAAAQVLRGVWRSPDIVLLTKVAAVAIVAALAYHYWGAEIAAAIRGQWLAGNYLASLIYVLLVSINLIGFAVLPFVASTIARVTISIVAALSIFADLTIRKISGAPLSLNLMEVMWSERAMAGGAFQTYQPQILEASLVAGFITICLVLPTHRTLSRRYVAIPLLALSSCIALSALRLDRMLYMPPIFSLLPQTVIVLSSHPQHDTKREPVIYHGALKSQVEKIVIVIDESVRGDVLSINDDRFDNLSSLSQHDPRFANFGVAISASNCSVAARIVLRAGLQKAQLPDVNAVWQHRPLIWDYAKAAGYRTVLLDTFSPVGEFHSYMTTSEAKTIDTIRSFMKGPSHDFDNQLAQGLKEELNKPGRALIYVNKHGIHAPYHWRLSPEYPYEPKGVEHVLPGSTAHTEDVRTYLRAVKYSVDRFFHEILPTLTGSKLLLYTSDHGQSLYQGGYDLTHCSWKPNFHRGEVYVPLFAIVSDPEFRLAYRSAATLQYNKADHFHLFATTLQAMGYDAHWTHDQFGSGLLDNEVRQERGFLLGVFNDPSAAWTDLVYTPPRSHRDVYDRGRVTFVFEGPVYWNYILLIYVVSLMLISMFGIAFGLMDLLQRFLVAARYR